MNLDLTSLKRRLHKKSGERDSVWPSLTLMLYSDVSLPKFGPDAAALLRRYISVIPTNVLRSALIRDDVGPFTARRFANDLKRLDAPQKGTDLIMLIYSSSEYGQPGNYGCYALLKDLDDKELTGPWETNVIKLEFPWTMAEGDAVEGAVDLLAELVECVPYVAATAGFGFSFWRDDRFAGDQVVAMLPRYSGFDHSDPECNNMRGQTPSATWLTFLSTALVEQLGGKGSIPPEIVTRNLKNGVMLRAAKHPIVGDVNRGALDIGRLPDVATWMKPLRFDDVSPLCGSSVEMDVDAWLQRFDERPSGAWDNR